MNFKQMIEKLSEVEDVAWLAFKSSKITFTELIIRLTNIESTRALAIKKEKERTKND